MNSIRIFLKEHVLKILISVVVLSFVGFATTLISEVGGVLLDKVLPEISRAILFKLWIALVILYIPTIVLILYLYSELKNKLYPKFGVLWDKKGNAYCNKCDSLLVDYISGTNNEVVNPHFHCHKCGQKNYISDDATILTYDQAKQRL